MDELRTALELATDDELRELTDVLFRRRFNPLDYVSTPDPIVVQSQARQEWISAIEERFRFLAADGVTVLTGKSGQLSYRQILVQVCRHLRLSYSESLSTVELEAEIFLHLLGKTWQYLPESDQQTLSRRIQRALTQIPQTQPLPTKLLKQPLEFLYKGGGILAIHSVLRPWVLQQLARQFASQMATYQVTRAALVASGKVTAAHASQYVALQMAKRGMAMTATRYVVARTVFACLGSAMWACFLVDLGWRTISTNYARILPTIFALAQIRLTRSPCLKMA